MATSAPATSTDPPTSSAGVGCSPSTSQAAVIATTGTSRIHGTTVAEAYRPSSVVKIA